MDRVTEMPMDFRLPALGEGIDTATVASVLVKPGDAVTSGQNVLAVETDKAAMDVAIDVGGTVGEIKVKPGDKIRVGGLVLTLANGEASKPKSPQAEPSPTSKADVPPAADAPPVPVIFQLPPLGEGIDTATVSAVLVKVGENVAAKQSVLSLETDKAAMDVPCNVAGTVTEIKVQPGDKIRIGAEVLVLMARQTPQPDAQQAQTPAPVKTESRPAPAPPSESRSNRAPVVSNDFIPAGPATRRLARELGVALREVRGSGRGGRVTLDDVKSFIREERQNRSEGGTIQPPLPDFAKYGEVERKPVSNLRKAIAANLSLAHRMIPAVTQHDLADITDLEAGRKRIVEGLPPGAAKITWTVLAVKACVAALKEYPHFNASFDMSAGELIYKKYFHIGIAVDTERGLVVPVIRNADSKSIRDIAAEVAELAEKARAGKLGLEEMRGGSFTITNLGGIGGTSFTPIVNYPEVAILGLSKSSWQPAVRDGAVVPRLLLPLSLTYDHRVIDGADGARFAARLTQLFSDPMRLLMES